MACDSVSWHVGNGRCCEGEGVNGDHVSSSVLDDSTLGG